MSTDQPRVPNQKMCSVPGGPKPVPRDPKAYRSSQHYINRLKQRVPEELQNDIAARCVRHGKLKAVSKAGHASSNAHQDFAFFHEIRGTTWKLVVGIVPQAFESEHVKHFARSIYPVEEER